MTRDGRFKQRVRARMKQTGENYVTARSALRPEPEGPLSAGSGFDEAPRWDELIERLGRPGPEMFGALDKLKSLPDGDRRRAAMRGLGHDSWRVRRQCCRILDDLALTGESIAAMTQLLDDEHPGVRRAALHTLVCEGCKPNGCDIDMMPLLQRMRHDPNADVRRQAIGPLWNSTNAATIDILREVKANDPSARVRDLAAGMLRSHERRLQAEAALQTLPEVLRAKVGRHAGKWVAVADGRIIGVDRHAGQVRRHAKGNGRPDALICWVPPEEGQEPPYPMWVAPPEHDD